MRDGDRVSLVMCVHDGWPYLREAVESVLAQERPVDRLVIVDDASRDEGVAYLDGIADQRLLVLRNPECVGPGASAQRGVDACGTGLVARLDADDVVEPWRIREQVSYMEAHPGAAMVCGSVRLIDERGAVTGEYDVPRPAVLAWELAFRNPVVQSTVMFRTEAFRAVGGYGDLRVAEDYDLWSRLVRSGAEVGSIRPACVRLRKHGRQVSERAEGEMLETAVDIAAANIEDLTGRLPDRSLVRTLCSGVGTREDARGAAALLGEITGAYLARHRPTPLERREISARAIEVTRAIIHSAGLDRAEVVAAMRSCLAGAGLSGLTTAAGARTWLRMTAPAGAVALRRRFRPGSRS